MSLRTVLLLRGAISVLFVAYLMLMSPIGDPQSGHNGYFALLDGLLGMALWFTLSNHPAGRWLSGLAFADAIMRLIIGVVTFIAPNIQSRMLGAVVYLGAIVVACIVLGAIGLIYVSMTQAGSAGQPPHPAHFRRSSRARAPCSSGSPWCSVFRRTTGVAPSWPC